MNNNIRALEDNCRDLRLGNESGDSDRFQARTTDHLRDY